MKPLMARCASYHVVLSGICFAACVAAQAAPERRIVQVIDLSPAVSLRGGMQPLAQARYDRGRADGEQVLHGLTLRFRLSDAQQQVLSRLLREQQDPASPQYHAWLSPAEYRERFGMSQDDLAAAQTWLRAQGFSIEGIASNANRISFGGSVAQVEAAFHTEMHRYRVGGESHLANATAPSLPSALAGVTIGLGNLSDFRPRPRSRALCRKIAAVPSFTSSLSGNHYLAPRDFATIYGLQALYSAGVTGSGQKLVVVGQSAIRNSDISAFRSAAGLSSNLPASILVPHSGSSTVQSESGDEAESDLDLEWSGTVAPDASVYFVYTGGDSNYGVFDALAYAVDNDTAPLISLSYGACEQDIGSSDIAALESVLQQASAQGQTVVAASGDSGAADCDYSTSTDTVTEASHGLAVDYPASSVYVTGVGGSGFVEGSGSYWSSSNDSHSASALSYIPETTWNDSSSAYGLAASGGGRSRLFSKPSWQSGSGVPADGVRDVPDLALAASPEHDGYLYCTDGSCVDGFRDSLGYLSVAGGTSFGAPAFTAVLALLAQKTGASALGNVNPRLYALAASSSGVFHDIVSGGNQVPCAAGSSDCGSGGNLGYSAAAGYDLATGLGSIDGFNLADQWTAASGTSSGSSGSASSSSSGSASGSSSSSSGSAAESSSGATAQSGGGGAFNPALLLAFALLLPLRNRR